MEKGSVGVLFEDAVSPEFLGCGLMAGLSLFIAWVSGGVGDGGSTVTVLARIADWRWGVWVFTRFFDALHTFCQHKVVFLKRGLWICASRGM